LWGRWKQCLYIPNFGVEQRGGVSVAFVKNTITGGLSPDLVLAGIEMNFLVTTGKG
jgi:hypothetical protein